MRTFIIVLLLLLSHESAFAKARVNMGAGYASGDQKFDQAYSFSALAWHIDVQWQWKLFLAGLNYASADTINIVDNKDSVSGQAAYVGISPMKFIDIIGGYAYGEWKRKRVDPILVTTHSDHSAKGSGWMAGVRVYLFEGNEFSFGLSGTHYNLRSTGYNQTIDGIVSAPNQESTGSYTEIGLLMSLIMD